MASVDNLDAQDRRIRREFGHKFFAILGSDHDDQLLDVITVDESLGRMQPHRSIFQRNKRLLVMRIAETAALSGGGQDDGES